ncbi:restriction endonuclease subunit S [Chryseobacterium gleum]|uniref:restriction endonuclease subunit S n=1 Tax=Chryseobacterium gleum TaxID=250 RepID=UPI0031CE0C14
MNKTEKKLVPELRFPEFINDEEWEIKEVEDFFSVGSSKRVLQKDWTNKGVPFYRTRELVSLSKHEPFSSEIFVSENLFSHLSENYGIPTEGDFLVSGVGTLGICYQVKKNDKFYFKDGNVLWFKINEGIFSSYFKFCFQSDFIQNQILAQTSKSTVGTYTIQNAKKTKFLYPFSLNEQQKIADCLSSLDELITAHNNKLEALKNHKKGLLQNLFPQEGQKVPNYRFPEFVNDGEWEEKTLGNIGNASMCKRIFKEETTNNVNDIPFYKIGTFGKSPDSFIPKEIYEDYKKRFSFPKKGDILISASGTIGRLVVYNGEPAYFQDSNIVWIDNKEDKVINNFLFYIYSLLNWQTSDGGIIQRLYNSDLKNMKIVFPKNKIEQQKIADCLISVDNLITSQSEKIEQLKAHKKGLMQGLFPKID